MQANLYAFFICIALSATSNAQPNRQLSLDLNRSFHGTGDMRGLGFAVEYGKFFRKRVEISGGLAANVFSDQTTVLVTYPNGQTLDASYREGTAGLQLHVQAAWAPLRNRHNEFKVALGPVLRYQSSSASGGVGIVFPIVTGYPEPLFSFRQVEDQNVVTAGYLFSLAYAYTLRNGLFFGAKASLQNDTNADVITQYGLRIGKRF